jgi:hypothetical protein
VKLSSKSKLEGKIALITGGNSGICLTNSEEPTLASVWHSVAGSFISDELLKWPADLFALTDVILERSEVYRFVLSPPTNTQWPPTRIPNWSEAVEQAGREWSVWVEDQPGAVPELVTQEWRILRESVGMPLEHLAKGQDWRLCEALLTLHAIADEACAGLGIALDRADGKGCVYRARGREVLARTGSLARIPSYFLRVQPKVRTPLNGTSLRSFSRYTCVHRPSVEARWYKVPARRSGTDPRARHANLLLLPWPLRVRESDFRPLEGSVQRLAKEPFGFFEFAPLEKLDLDLVSRTIVAARDEVDSVDVVILPESAIDEEDVNDLEALLDSHGVIALITGVRQRSPQQGHRPGNWVHFGASPRLQKAGPLPSSIGEQWFHVRQNKHHRWSLDEGQIYQYHLGGTLHPHVRWWEAMDVPRRTIQFIELGDEITMASLVCEDLAQVDDVADVIRSVGPTVVVTPLLDGPQLKSRWAARYASVLADDPGSAVLTLTSFGMVQRSRPHGRDSSAIVALWKDPVRGSREIPLEAGAQGVLLTVCGDRATRSSADGRSPVDNVTRYFDVAVHQVRATSSSSGFSKSQLSPLTRRVLDVDELTILTGWAQAVAEALAYAPESVETLLADAQAGAAWRVRFGIADPSPQLSEAICLIGRAVREVTPPGGQATFDALHILCSQNRPAERGLDNLVRRVLQSTLEQLRTRQAHEIPGIASILATPGNGNSPSSLTERMLVVSE